MLSSCVSATLVYLKSEQSSCPRKFKEKADGGQTLFPCQDEKHWPLRSGTCPGCCSFQPLAFFWLWLKSLPCCRQGWEANSTETPSYSGCPWRDRDIPEQDVCCCWAGSCTGRQTPRGWLSLQVTVTCSSGSMWSPPLAMLVLSLPGTIRWYHMILIMINTPWWPATASNGLSGAMSPLWYRDNHL